ncbi:hypothetical protein [Lactiplantibacillus mudanjiangensis]|uniref:Uncharacterized protein n=1 Tax=Lactiplantibacillus mudanjiangensis TaxID=1296538 RepID=A0A660DUI3_9LACO|nr:hypothetical protein [Lactiplantibacillus mudanjiangensis]VDG20891.1 hypothetical protein [Lactobacillus brevis ATCC 367] [Lactiplantibacillus mudanjiangensis]VDG22622.1 hypothetical protein [Lactobacillus brevis ATCC 367] [Lactiplantibacillus mudanjiangensis]VDG26837.1 hypothetical protein [Lactobacillus brevis ATCC 367] [Lactiplantibacillus mudanjiangensis]VDG31980.1 hypothetical protein [Lactobacillus brevis ATCC 367] [Lactiplantibacillus mudanjiangensis]
MKNKRQWTIIGTIVVIAAVIIGGWLATNQTGSKSAKSSSATTTQAALKPAYVKKTVQVTNRLWYVAGSIKNPNSGNGMEAYDFKSNGKVVIYNIPKFYADKAAAKKAGKLIVSGTVKYTVSQNKKNQTVIKLKGKLSGIDFAQTLTLKKTVSGTHGKLSLTGYHVARNVDNDVTQAVFVRVK